jgi:hypothetical protein
VLDALLDRPQHVAAVPTGEVAGLCAQVFGVLAGRVFRGRADARQLAAHVTPVAIVEHADALAGAVVLLNAVPAVTRGLLLRTPRVDAQHVAPFLSPPGAGGISTLVLERETAAALPRWSGALREACQAAGATLELLPGALLSGEAPDAPRAQKAA